MRRSGRFASRGWIAIKFRLMNATITFAIRDSDDFLSQVCIYKAPIEEHLVDVDDSQGLGVMRVFPDPDGKKLWHTFVRPHGDCQNERVHVIDLQGNMRETNVIILSILPEGGGGGSRRFGER